MSKINDLLRQVNKKIGGEGPSVALFGDLEKQDVKRISTGLPSLDLVLGGGLPEGRLIEIFGPESSGKTTTAIKFLAEVQKKYPESYVAFIDVEHAFDPVYAEALGLDMKKVIFSQPDSAENALTIMLELAQSGKVKAIILDSVAQLVPNKEVSGNMGDAEMGMRARLMSQVVRKLGPLASKSECTCFFINQTRMKIGEMYGNPETTPGGSALRFGASIRIRTTLKKKDEGAGETTMVIIKNKVGVPFKRTTIRLAYGIGFDYMHDLITTAKVTGVISRAGAFYKYGKHTWQGEEKMREAIAKDEKMQKEIKEVIINSTT